MASFVLIHGAGSDWWYWHRVVPLLKERGHEAIGVDLPCDDDSAGLLQYTDAVVHAIGDRRAVVLVAQSLAGFSAPLACERAPVAMLVLLNAMIPTPGEPAGEWWANTGQPQAMLDLARREGHAGAGPELMNDPEYLFLHDLPPDIAAESANHVRSQSGTPFGEPWPLNAWPDVPTRVIVGRDDRLFPLDFQRRVAVERLNIEPDELDGGHLAALSRPADVAERLVAYLSEP